MDPTDDGHGGWVESAEAWIEVQGEDGDRSRREILDPALESILGPVRGLHILDVGCGEGRYARVLAARGAKVTGIDPVPAFVALARDRHPEGEYVAGHAEALPFPDNAFDLVLSYLSLVDISDYREAIAEMVRVTKSSPFPRREGPGVGSPPPLRRRTEGGPGGRIVAVTIANYVCTLTPWIRDDSGRKLHRPVDRYMEERSMVLEWKGISIVNYHRPLSAILTAFFDAGCVMDGFYEPLPAPDSEIYADEFRAPNFQIMSFRK